MEWMLQVTHDQCFKFVLTITGSMGGFVLLLCGAIAYLYKALIREKNRRILDHVDAFEKLTGQKRR